MSMRMRKKRNFDVRMEACGDLLVAKGANGILNMKEAAENYRALIDFSTAFGNDNPVFLEIGCGKGGFVIALAEKHIEDSCVDWDSAPFCRDEYHYMIYYRVVEPVNGKENLPVELYQPVQHILDIRVKCFPDKVLKLLDTFISCR